MSLRDDGAAQTVREAMLRKIRFDIGLFDHGAAPEAIVRLVGRIALAGLDGITREALLQTIKKQTGTPLDVLRKQLKSTLRERRAPAMEGLILGPAGEPLALEANAVTIIREKLDGLFALDEFAQAPMVMRAPPWERGNVEYPRRMTDRDDAALLGWVQREGVHLRGRPAIKTVMVEVIHDHAFHPVRDYLRSLVWDGVPRLDRMLITYFGCEEIPNYTTVIGPMWMISAVARIERPGCMVKYVLLLLGPQDLGKSTALSILGGDWYTDDIAELGSKDAAMQSAGIWIIELAELASTRKGDINSIKAFISRKEDRFRPPYGEKVLDRPRQSVLAGTVNPSPDILKDETGNVRYWPATCTRVDFDALRRDRNQLWAEAAHRYGGGERWWPDDGAVIEAAHLEQEAHTEQVEDHPWFPLIEEWLRDNARVIASTRCRSDGKFVFTMAELLDGALTIPKERMTDLRSTRQARKILRRLGGKSGAVRLKSDPDAVVRRWQPCDEESSDQ